MEHIINIFWERSNLHIILDQKVKSSVFITNNKEKIKLEQKNEKEYYLNLTNTEKGSMLEADNWKFYIDDNPLKISKDFIKELDNLSRNFKYRNNLYAYLVNFKINSDFELSLITDFMIKNYKPKSFYRLAETKSIKRKIKIILLTIIVFMANSLYRFARTITIKKNIVLFLTENNNELQWNLKSMHDYLKNQNKYKIEIYARDKYKSKSNLIDTITELLKIAKANIIFVDNYTPILTHLKLNKKVKLLQLWHAGIGFKSVGYARFGLEGSPHPYKSCHRNYTDAIVDQEDLSKIYQEVFGVKQEIFHSTGMPRLNDYLDENKIKKTCESLFKINSKLKTNKVILFSPTYRGTGSHSAYYNYEKINIKKIVELCKKNNCIFIIKNHPFIKESINILDEYKEYIYDYSTLDINDLIYVSDIMITDYSSCAYEYSLFDRPLIFYRYDKEIYEYERPIHTVDKFTAKQYETKEFDEVIRIIEKIIKNINVENRFNNIKLNNRKINSCKAIEEIIIGE